MSWKTVAARTGLDMKTFFVGAQFIAPCVRQKGAINCAPTVLRVVEYDKRFERRCRGLFWACSSMWQPREHRQGRISGIACWTVFSYLEHKFSQSGTNA